METRETEPVFSGFYGADRERPEDLAFNFERFMRKLEARRDRGQYVVVLIDGQEPGVGKSTLGIHICRRLDPEFSLERFAWRGRDLRPAMTNALSTRKGSFSMIQLDEPEDLMSRGGRKDELLIQIAGALGRCRKNGIGAVLLAPKKSWYDSFVRDGLIPYWVFVERPGVGRLHRAWKGTTYKNSQSRVMYDRAAIGKIGFTTLDGDPFFEEYERAAESANRAIFSEPERGRRAAQPRNAAAEDHPTGPERSMSPSNSPAAAEEWKCGQRVFARKDNYQRHLMSRAHQHCPR